MPHLATDDLGGREDWGLSNAGSRPETLSRHAYAAVRRAINQGDIVPGSLYSEGAIAKLLDVSRTPVREALIELAREKVVEKVPQRGFRLRQPSVEELREAFDLRELVECYVVRRVAIEAPDTALVSVARLLKDQASAVDDFRRFAYLGEAFHLGLPTLLGLERSRSLIDTVRASAWRWSGSNDPRHAARKREVIIEHKRVLDGLAARDGERAAAAMLEHLRRSSSQAFTLVSPNSESR